jgi:RNA-directed DNA polymerase
VWRNNRQKVEAALGLKQRGLELSQEKTVITHITKGFTFLGQTFRKQGDKLHITPSKNAIKSIPQKLGDLMRKHVASPAPALIKALNQTLRGWGNYHKHVVSSEAFTRIDTYVFDQLWRILRKRHPKKSKYWLFKRSWTASGRSSRFSVKHTPVDHCVKVYSVIRLNDLPRSRFVKIKAEANPYKKEYAGYFYERRHNRKRKELGALSSKEYRERKLH